MDIAVIGSGIAGLTTTWLLSRRHRVTVYERLPRLGLDAFSVDVPTRKGSARVDVPLRVVMAGYYPTLLDIYRELGIGLRLVDYAASFSRVGQRAHFRYRNLLLPGRRRSLSFLGPRRLLQRDTRHILRDLVRLRLHRSRLLASPLERGPTLGDFLAEHGYSDAFTHRFLAPAFAGIGTCTYDAILRYPAAAVARYLYAGRGVLRVEGGIRTVVQAMAAGAHEVCLDTPIVGVERGADGVIVRTPEARRFDQVVLATPADVALRILGSQATPPEREALSAFRHEIGEVVVHTDPSLAPDRRADWATVNFMLSPEHDRPMATIWLNRVHAGLRGEAPVFESWSPIREPAPDRVITRARFARPLLDPSAAAASRALCTLQRSGSRRVWFAGSYLGSGIPLLESAAASAAAVAARLAEPGSARASRKPMNGPR